MQVLLHGQEIYLFFYRYGINGIYGIVLCSILIGIVIYKTLNIVLINDVKTYKEFQEIITDRFNMHKYLNLSQIINITVNIFLVMTFVIMISGFGAYFNQEYRN